MLDTNPIIETKSAKTNNGNLPSISSEFNPLGSKLIKRAIQVTPADKDQPNNSIKFCSCCLNTNTADNKIRAIK